MTDPEYTLDFIKPDPAEELVIPGNSKLNPSFVLVISSSD